MEAKQLIESGALELYVMNSLPAEEMKQIDDLRKQEVSVNEELLRIENALEDFAFAQSRKPKPELKEEIAARIGLGVELDLDMENIKAVIIHLKPLMRLAAAAAILLIVGLSIGTVYFYAKFRSAKEELVCLHQAQSVLAQHTNNIIKESESARAQLAFITNPENKQIILSGLKISPSSKAIVYWNKASGTTYINCSGLPSVEGSEQFQLWALVDGKPVDMGVLSKDCSIAEMKPILNASAFAITLEPLGGRTTPTMEKMYVIGNV